MDTRARSTFWLAFARIVALLGSLQLNDGVGAMELNWIIGLHAGSCRFIRKREGLYGLTLKQLNWRLYF
jgi:hypothetical protein